MKSRVLYFKTKTEQTKWLEKINKVLLYTDIQDHYTFGETLGKGQFGHVKVAVNKATEKKYAVKIINKKDIRAVEVYQLMKEIDVLKIGQHPNIVQLVDIYENTDYNFLVLELMEGKDMFDYLKAREFLLSEDRVRNIVY